MRTRGKDDKKSINFANVIYGWPHMWRWLASHLFAPEKEGATQAGIDGPRTCNVVSRSIQQTLVWDAAEE